MPVSFELPEMVVESRRRKGSKEASKLPFPDWALIDTGAELSIVSAKVIDYLESEPIGVRSMTVADGSTVPCTTHVLRISIGPQDALARPIEQVFLRSDDFFGDFEAIIGRDILKLGYFNWLGPEAKYVLWLPAEIR